MVSFIAKLLRLSRPYGRRLALGVLMGLLGGFLEPLLMLCVKVAVDVAFPGASAVAPGFSAANLRDLPAFASRLKQHEDEVSKFLWNRLSPATREQLAGYSPAGPAPKLLPETLAAELNLILLDPAFYDPQRFAGIKLSPETQELISPDAKKPQVVLRNQLLLADAFPLDLSRDLPGFSADSIMALPAFTQRLKGQSNEVSKFLWSKFSPATREQLSQYSGRGHAPKLLPEALAGELNLITLDPSLYDPARFANVRLSPEADRLLAEKPEGVNVARLNQVLLENAYPGLLSVKHTLLDKFPRVRERLAALLNWFPAGGGSIRSLNVTLVILAIPMMMMLRGLVSYLNVYFLQWVAIRAVTDLRTRLFAHLMNMPLAFLNKISTGELLSRVSGDTGALQNAISNSLVVLIKDPATVVGLIALLLWQEPMLTLFSMVVFPVCLVPIVVYSRKVRQSSSAIQTQYARLSKIMHEAFTGNRIIKAYNLEHNVVAQFREASARYIGHFMRATRAGEMPGPLIELFGAIGVACLFYYMLVVSPKDISPGDFLLFVGSVFSLYKPIKSLTRLYTQLSQAHAASERVFELLATASTLPEPANPVPLKGSGMDILFDNITFNYETKPVLRNFNLIVKAGQMVALVGQTGSGKTTATNLLLRFYDPQSGAVRIGGIDIRQVATRDLRSQIAVVTQDTLLFDESIRRNIELGRPGATEQEIIAAAKHAHAHEFIMDKEGGYDALIGEKGVTLSGGQKQRLAIARAILKNAPILILDEATSSLDTQTERAVQVALEELMQGRTTLCIAHRLSTIQKADLIVVLDKGSIVEMGRHNELLGRDGVYRRLYELDIRPERQPQSE